MTHIAHWLYSNPGLQSGVTEKQLIQECATYLYPRRYEHFEDAEKAATDFIEFCRGRAWVFSDTGTTPSGDSLYQFTHRTFLEYFTALYLFRTNPKPTDLLGVLWPRIARGEWDVVAQLAFHIVGREVEGGGDELLEGLVSAATTRPADQWNYLTFAGRCLEFISCSPKTSRSVAESAVTAYLSWCSKTFESGKLHPRSPASFEAGEMVANLLHTGLDNRNTVAETIERALSERIRKHDSTVALVAAEAAVTLPFLLHRPSDIGRTKLDLKNYWRPIRNRILDSSRNDLLEIYRTQIIVACAAYFAGVISFEDLIAWHSTKPIFKTTSSSTHIESWAPIGQMYLFHVVGAPQSATLSTALLEEIPALESIGSVLLRSPTPWASKPDFTMRFIDWVTGPSTSQHGPPPVEVPSLSPDALFAAFALAASAMEAIEHTKLFALVTEEASPLGIQLGLLSPLRRLLFSRVSHQTQRELDSELTAAALTAPQRELALRWAGSKVNFIRHHGKRPKAQAK